MKRYSNGTIIRGVIVIVAAVAIVSIAMIVYLQNEPVIIQGRIECQNTIISGKLLGRIDRLHVREGDIVGKGDTLVTISSPEIEAQLTSASAMESIAQYQNRKVDSGTRREIVKSLKEAYLAAKANYELAEKSYKRSRQLFEDSIVTPQKMDEVEALLKNAEAAEKAAKYQFEMAEAGAQQEDKASSLAMIKAAKGNVIGLESLLADSRLVSPDGGQVSSIFLSEGELVMPGSAIMEIINTDSCYVVLNIKENYLEDFYIGCEFMGSLPAFGYAKMAFKVFYISPLGSFANWTESKDGNSYSLVTFQIKAYPTRVIDTAADNGYIARLRPGMSVLVELDSKYNR